MPKNTEFILIYAGKCYCRRDSIQIILFSMDLKSYGLETILPLVHKNCCCKNDSRETGSDFHQAVVSKAQSCSAEQQQWDSSLETNLPFFPFPHGKAKGKPAHHLRPKIEFLPMMSYMHIKNEKRKRKEKERSIVGGSGASSGVRLLLRLLPTATSRGFGSRL